LFATQVSREFWGFETIRSFAAHGFQYAERDCFPFLFVLSTRFGFQVSSPVAAHNRSIRLNFQPITKFNASLERSCLPLVEPKKTKGGSARRETEVCTEETKCDQGGLSNEVHKVLDRFIGGGLLALAPVVFAKNQGEAKTEQDRLQNAGKVMQEILNVPDDIRRTLLTSRCVDGHAVGAEQRRCCWGQLRPRRDGVPHR